MAEHRTVALEALRRYDIVPRRVRLAAESFNSIFRVTTASAVYALRVGAVLRIHPEPAAAVEAAWRRQARISAALVVPDVLANADGETATLVADDRAQQGTRVSSYSIGWPDHRCTDRHERAAGGGARQIVGPAAP